MARAVNGGWDFVKVGGLYQVKEDFATYGIRVLEDTSDAEQYVFKVKPTYSSHEMSGEPFTIMHHKNPGGVWSGMLQIYERDEYVMLPIGTPWPFTHPEEVQP